MLLNNMMKLIEMKEQEIATLKESNKTLLEENYSLNKEIELLSADVEKIKHENFGLKQTIKNQERQLDKYYNASLGR